MAKDLAARVQRIKPSPTLAVTSKADELQAAGHDIINLGVGEPDFDTPAYIKEAAIKAINNNFTRYTPVDGTRGLKKAVINKFAIDNNLHYTPDQILVSCGAKHSIFNMLEALLNPGDEVIIPAPYWVSYPDMAKLADAIPVVIKTDVEQNFKITPAQLAGAITPQTRIVIFNSPSNPTGKAYTRAELKALGEVLLPHPDIIVLTDDIYEHILWSEEPFCNILMACPELHERTVVINGVSKSHCMTGWRIGFAAGPSKIISAMKKVQSQSTSNPASISQAAAEVALNGDQSFLKTMCAEFKRRHDFICAEFQKIPGFKCIPCDGTFYIFPDATGLIAKLPEINNDIELSEFFLTQAGVACVPGSAFGLAGYLRFSFSINIEKIASAVQRMHQAIEKALQAKKVY